VSRKNGPRPTKAFLLIFRRKRTSCIIEQLSHIGAKTMGIVSLIGLFTGMVMALQVYHALGKMKEVPNEKAAYRTKSSGSLDVPDSNSCGRAAQHRQIEYQPSV
jgi:hypothetical protein